MFITVTHCTTTSKESACRITCTLSQQTSPKCWFANVNMASYSDVTNSLDPVTAIAMRHCSILEFDRGRTIEQSSRASLDLYTPPAVKYTSSVLQ